MSDVADASTKKGKGKKKEGESKYSSTVILPTTTFDQRANSLKLEPELQKWWKEQQIYEKTIEKNTGSTFVLHDGPPYANGNLHIGHALNKILKDIINKYQVLKGKKVKYVPGWDCHGLPIELKVLQTMKTKEREGLTPLTLRKKAADFAMEAVNSQREAFKRYGVWGDWDKPYMTLQPEYEAAQIRVFGDMMLKGHIYRGKKPVHWSPSSRTALAEAELEYPDNHISRSIYVAFSMVAASPKIQSYIDSIQKDSSTPVDMRVTIWTTTPWTIPANLAVAVNGDLQYCIASHPTVMNDAKMIVAKDLVGSLSAKFGLTDGESLKVEFECLGSELVGTKYQHPLFDRQSEIVIGGDYITTDSGTGLVHTAPGHGVEDYITGLKYNLPLLSPVNDEGRFTAEVGERFAGLDVLGDGNTAIITALGETGTLVKEEAYNHKYPYDWRTKKPTIFRATEQWFASVSSFRADVLKAIDEVQWIPAVGKNRITSMTESRGDWCISRQRSWGVPIPVFYSKLTNEPLINSETIKYVEELFAKHGSDIWWEKDVSELLPPGPLREKAAEYSKGTDTMDVWFDSGTSWAGVVKNREELTYPADIYLEGSDQHRGWFQSSLLTSVATQGCAPFKTVLTHGFVLDEKGFKMSKSLGNVVDPLTVIEGGSDQKAKPAYGADTLRLWVAGVDYSGDVCVGENIMKQVSDSARKLRNTLRFLVGSLTDFDPAKDLVPYEQLSSIDKYMLGNLGAVVKEVEDAYENFQFFRVVQALTAFTNVEVSAFYLDIAKDRLYISHKADIRRKACQTVIYYLMEHITKMIAPVLPHMAENLWLNIPYTRPQQSVFLNGWIPQAQVFQPHEVEFWSRVRELRYEINKAIELARQVKAVGATQECKAIIYVEDKELRSKLEAIKGDVEGILPTPKSTNMMDDLRFILLTSQIEFRDSAEEVQKNCPDYNLAAEIGAGKVHIGITLANGKRCERCWFHSENVGHDHEHSDVCVRCATVIRTDKHSVAVSESAPVA